MIEPENLDPEDEYYLMYDEEEEDLPPEGFTWYKAFSLLLTVILILSLVLTLLF